MHIEVQFKKSSSTFTDISIEVRGSCNEWVNFTLYVRLSYVHIYRPYEQCDDIFIYWWHTITFISGKYQYVSIHITAKGCPWSVIF
jgi:hypothetical protein